MKRYIYFAVAVIAALSGCSSDNDPVMGGTVKRATVFTATMEGAITRTTLDVANNKASWEENDQISINGVLYNAQVSGLSTTFKPAVPTEEATGATFEAFYPASLSDYEFESLTLPAEINERWAEGQFNMPMYAKGTTTDLAFKNLCGVLKITVKSDQIASVKSIRVSSSNCATSGRFRVDASTYAAKLTIPSAVSNTVTVTYDEAVSTTPEGKVFYIAIPAQDYQNLRISVSDGSVLKVMTTKSGTTVTVDRNTMYPVTFKEDVHDYVEVGGIKWAKHNLGATTVAGSPSTSFGDYYAWGEIYPRYTAITITDAENISFSAWQNYHGNGYSYLDEPTYTGTTLDAEHDAATQAWGSQWHTPTLADFQTLYAACGGTGASMGSAPSGSASTTDMGIYWCDDYNGVKGFLFSDGTNTVFFPAAGSVSNTGFLVGAPDGNYWSSTIYTGRATQAYYLIFSPSMVNPAYTVKRYVGMNIRPVSD